MHNMEDGVGSGDGSSDVIKKKSSSGCLIIKKKGNGVLGFGGSGSKTVLESNEKKRSRLADADSVSSDEVVEPVRRKVREDIIYERRKSGIELEDARMAGFGGERKRSGFDVFEFDEYDGFDGKKMRMDYWEDRLKGAGRSGNYRDYGVGASRNAVYRNEDHERKGSMSGVKSKGMHYSGKGRYEAKEEEDDDDEESHLPISFLKQKCREVPSDRIRLQGKNGVLKVMVKKKKQGFPDKGSDYPRADESMGSRSEAAIKKNEVIRHAFYSDSKRTGKLVSLKTEKSYKKSEKALPILSSKAEDSETDDSEKSLEQESMSKQTQRSKKAIKNEQKKTLNEHKKIMLAELSTPPSGGKESKVTRGNGTEKQLLREKIRTMLLERGWRIDYRPRKNRDYLDAVYINPAGTAYWSIIKAYDALQKQLEEEDIINPCGESTSSTALPEEIISKLTRQTRKKIERDLKKKKREAAGKRSAKEVTMRESANGTDSDQHEEKLSSYMKQSNKSLKGRLNEADHSDENDSSDGVYKRKAKQDMAEKQYATNSHMIQGRKSKKIGRCTLLARSSDNGLNSGTDGYVPCTGKRTLLSWLIDSEIVHMSEKVQYMNRRKTKVMLEGWITKDGIHCGCCSKILTVSKFEIHAGSKQRQPFPNMYLESGLSLMQCQIDAWNKQEESKREGFHNVDVDGDDPNDDTCGLCGDGGDLMCCDGCPSTFHQSCLDIKILPEGDWHCPNCTCKFCGFAGCSNGKANDKTDNPLLLCSLCERKYHQSCSQDEVDLSVDSGGAANLFCGKNCQEIFSHLQKLLGVKQELESGFSWSVVHRMDPASETSHLGFSQRVECNSKLAVALSVMDECFLPIVDRRSGINLIHKVLYNCGSNFSRLNYSGFYTAILERGDEIMSVASIRIHGNQLAEMPFIGTRHIYRRQGMCRRLLSAIKSALRTLKVEKLIIPAIAEHMQTWTENFKFSPLMESHKQEMRSMNMLVFPRTDMLQKLLVKREIMEGSTSNNSGSQSNELQENCLLPVLGEKSELESSPEQDTHMSDNTELQPLTESSNNVTALISASETPTLVTNDIPAVCSSLASFCEPKDGKSVLDLTPEHDAHMSDNTELFPLTESSDKATALISASETPAPASNDIPEISTSLASSCEPKHEPAMAETPPVNPLSDNNLAELKPSTGNSDKASTLNSAPDATTLASYDIPAMSSCLVSSCESKHEPAVGETPSINPISDNNLAELQPLTERSEKTTVLISASETPTPASSEIPAISSSDVSSCEPKHEHAFGEIPATNPLSDNSLAESIFNLKSTSLCNENPSTIAADNGLLGSSLKDYTQSSVNDVITDVLEMNAKATSVKLEDDTLQETLAGNIEEDATDIQNCVSCDKSESTHVDSDMNNCTAVDLGDTYEVNVDETLSNSPKKAVEQLSATDTVDVDASREASIGSEEDGIAIEDPVHVHDSVSRGTCGSLHNDSGMGSDPAVDLDNINTCEVKANDTFVNSPKDSVEQLSTMNTVDEGLAENGTITLCKGGNVVDNTHTVQEKVACVKPVTDSFNKGVAHTNSYEEIGEGPTKSSSMTVMVGDKRNGDLITSEKGDELGDAQEVNVEVASAEPIVDFVCDTSTENHTCQALDESSKDVKSDSIDRSLVDIESDLHVTTVVASNTKH